MTRKMITQKEMIKFSLPDGSVYDTEEEALKAFILTDTTSKASTLAKTLYPSSRAQTMIVNAIVKWELHKEGLLSEDE